MKKRFVYRPERESGVTRVDLFGETSDWRNGVPLDRDDSDGAFAVSIDLPIGVYQYKLLVSSSGDDDCTDRTEWLLDADNPRTRSEKGLRNSVVVIDGSDEPFLFAPSPPWIEELERGGLRVLIGVRREAVRGEEAPTIAWSENDGESPSKQVWSRTTTTKAFEEDEHVFFTATLPASAPSVALALILGSSSDDKKEARYETRWSRAPAALRLPAWWKRATIYGIFVDRFRPAVDRDGWERDPGKRVGAGGHLDGIGRSLDELADLGIDTLYLTPVHVGASAHRYDVVDPLTIDPALGGEEAYRALVRDARRRDMRVIQDISFAHVGRGFPPYEDVLIHGASSRFAAWFVWRRDDIKGKNEPTLVHYGKRTEAPLLDQTNPEVQALALQSVELWAKRGASGLRLDMTAEVPLDLGRRIRRRFRELVPDGVVFGELVPQHAWRWRSGWQSDTDEDEKLTARTESESDTTKKRTLSAGVIDSATDFGFHEIVTDLVCRPRASVAEAFERLARTALLRGGDAHVHAVRFLSTHDHPRLATLASAKGPHATARLALAYVLLATLPGIPMLLYGEELGLRSTDPHRDLEDVWPDRMPMPWAGPTRDPAMRAMMQSLLRARRDSEALRSGSFTVLFADESTVVYRREVDTEVIDVALNFADDEPKTIELEDDDHPGLASLVAIGGADAVGVAVKMPPGSAIIARRDRMRGRAISPVLARRNLVLRDRDLVLGAAEATARPSRFFFSVTERCNLRCEHCITHAPERTKNGTARTMTHAVLDALALGGDLGLADYFAFVHGGESLTSPIFFDVLEAIAASRDAEPYVAHLLTNGVLLSVPTAKRLVDRGVSSMSFSLDGATAETNDAIRTGGRFDEVRENLRRLLMWRKEEKIDLRVGLSFVVLRQNAHELDAFVDLGAVLGVDWIKLEEGVPATAFAKRSLVSCTAPEIRTLIDRAMTRGRTHGLVMVDHTIDREIWRCRLDEDASARAFLEADEMANRCIIHPCRTPWETACIEPNGDVRARDFFGPILGNITQTPLAQLWNAPIAQQLRRDASLTRLCGPSGPVVCLDPAP